MMNDTPQHALARFIDAFSRLDLDAMLDCFAGDATAFFPTEYERARLDGKKLIGSAFARVIAQVRGTGRDRLHLCPEDLRVQDNGETALATFHLRGEPLSRRTFVLGRQDGRWQIVHMHASNAAST